MSNVFAVCIPGLVSVREAMLAAPLLGARVAGSERMGKVRQFFEALPLRDSKNQPIFTKPVVVLHPDCVDTDGEVSYAPAMHRDAMTGYIQDFDIRFHAGLIGWAVLFMR